VQPTGGVTASWRGEAATAAGFLTAEGDGETSSPPHPVPSSRGRKGDIEELVMSGLGEPKTAEAVCVVTEYLATDYSILAFKLLSLKPGYTYEVSWVYK
jgi:hypothetical protein